MTNKSTILGIAFLLISIGFMPIGSTINNDFPIYDTYNDKFEGLNNSEQLPRHVYRIYFLGKITNLSVDGDDYEFESNNIRKFRYWRFNFRCFGFEYEHFTGSYHQGIRGFRFRGILRPNFIFGCFYTPPW